MTSLLKFCALGAVASTMFFAPAAAFAAEQIPSIVGHWVVEGVNGHDADTPLEHIAFGKNNRGGSWGICNRTWFAYEIKDNQILFSEQAQTTVGCKEEGINGRPARNVDLMAMERAVLVIFNDHTTYHFDKDRLFLTAIGGYFLTLKRDDGAN